MGSYSIVSTTMVYSFQHAAAPLKLENDMFFLMKVVCLGTSNIGYNLVFKHYDSRLDLSKPVTREEYRDLIDLFGPHVSQCLGVSA